MEPMNLALICGVAFVAVFFLLSLLAVVMYGITAVFPERAPAVEPELVAAISSAVAIAFPGARVTRIEEEES